jgi:hypothetical protein
MNKFKSFFRYFMRGALIGSVIALIIGIPISNYRQKVKIEREIKEGRIKYYKHIGWIDWGHAIPTGPAKWLDTLSMEEGVVTYCQSMSINVGKIKFSVRVTNKYSIPKDLHDSCKEGAIHYIFNDVSNDFENIQGSFPYFYVCGNGLGDRNGNEIALIRALGKHFDPPQPLASDSTIFLFKKGNNENNISTFLSQKVQHCFPVKKIDSRVRWIFE